MQKNIMPFSQDEIEVLKGSFTKIAKKRDCDQSYVSRIAKGDRKTNTEKSKWILHDLQQILSVLKPI